MKEISFKNKVWIAQRKLGVHKWLIILCSIYLILSSVVIIMEGVTFFRGFSVFAAIIIVIWSKTQDKKAGEYVEADCKISFSDNCIRWEYPDITLQPGKPNSHVIYNFSSDDIKNITVSSEMGSMRVECSPVVEYITGGNHKTIDFRKGNKSCVLITYNYNIYELEDLFRQYTGKTAARMD